jgi:predicted ATPase
MAKKVVATLKKEGGQNIAKCIKMVRSPKTGAYQFKEAIMDKEFSKEFFSRK